MPPREIDAPTLNRWLREGSATLVDVREPAEHQTGRIAGATLNPLSRFDAQALAVRPDRLVIHCLKGGRGRTACEKLLAQNPALEVYNLQGGLEAWAAAGLPVLQGSRRVLPLDRQVQLAIGLILIGVTAASLLAHPAFVWLAGAVGLGLAVAGATGFCGMARVMARMPWNKTGGARQDAAP